MSAAAVMLVKDEADIVATTVEHLLTQLDRVYVADNLSTDGTTEILERLALRYGPRVTVLVDPQVAYMQADKTTSLAARAASDGFDWIVPVDADEVWYSPFGRLADVLDALPPQFLFVAGQILNHVATEADPFDEPDPVRRLGWRILEPGELPKVACRALPELRIGMGNHDARASGPVSSTTSPTIHGQVYIHHYPWRSAEQFLRKITNGARAYAASDLGDEYGDHWRSFGMPEDDGFEARVRAWFWEWGYRPESPPAPHPEVPDEAIIYDPAVLAEGTW